MHRKVGVEMAKCLVSCRISKSSQEVSAVTCRRSYGALTFFERNVSQRGAVNQEAKASSERILSGGPRRKGLHSQEWEEESQLEDLVSNVCVSE